ncbi:MAG: molybdopterin molybdotransferase MoeA [Gracilibacteraceae bacterium]|jgi:molybdopterin molybdotransferase|nr:molybdopterin molybdotransferase MoeA [Gracilibacteraceae bacterium]
MELLQVDTLETARGKLRACLLETPLQTEEAVFPAAFGRILAEDLRAEEDIPAFKRSTVDGYALAAKDTAAAGTSIPALLRQVGAVEMGRPAEITLQAGECAYVPTGGMVPAGADAVVMVEYCQTFGQAGVAVSAAVAAGENIVLPGDDVSRGARLLARGARLRVREEALLAAAGIRRLQVYTPLRVAVISTGNELVPPETRPRPGQVRDVNTTALAALARAAGFRVETTAVLADDAELLLATARRAALSCDLVLISGGSSQGEDDLTAAVLARAADQGLCAHGLALKPGKPTILAYDRATRTVFVGLPGHPLSALIVFDLLIAQVWRELTGAAGMPALPAMLTRPVAGSPGKDTVQLVALTGGESGQYLAAPLFTKSGLVSGLARADGYILIDRNTEGLRRGATVRVELFDPGV